MAKLARWQATIVDEAGNIQPGASVEVRLESTGNLAVLYSDSAGASGVLNPRTADADGYVFFYTESGDYKITASLGGFERIWRDECVLTAEDATRTDHYREVTAAGAVTVADTDVIVGINKTVGAATTVNIPLAANRGGQRVVIKDIKGDANVNPITPAFTGGELCDGLAGSAFQITTPYGWVAFYPRSGAYHSLGNQL